MHVPITKTRMDEETFEILFRVMEKHFAALKIPDTDNDFKLTRAVSFSELPSARRICVEQCYRTDNTPVLLRQYSCEQIFDKTSNTRQVKISEVVRTGSNERKNTWETTVPYDNFKVPEWRPRSNTNVIHAPKFVQNEVEYMEVEDLDSINKSIKDTEESQTAPTEASEVLCQRRIKKEPINSIDVKESDTYRDLKKKLRPLVPMEMSQSKEKRSLCYRCCRSMLPLFFVLLPLTVLIITSNLNYDKYPDSKVCNHRVNFVAANMELRQKIYGQPEAISTLVDQLESSDTSCLKVLFLVGGTGVGKSYTSEIIRKNFPNKHKIFTHFPPFDKIRTSTFSSIYCNLLILDNLKDNDISHFYNLMRSLQELDSYCITVLVIYNQGESGKDTDPVETFEQYFRAENIKATAIWFKPLSESILEKCIVDAAQESHLELTKDQVDSIKEGLLTAKSGCKGAYSKVQVIGRI